MTYKVILKKDGNQVGEIGEYDTMREATQVANEFNIKFERRAGKAHVVPNRVRNNPIKPKRTGGLVLRSSSNDSQTENRVLPKSNEKFSLFDDDSEDIEESEEFMGIKETVQEYPDFERYEKSIRREKRRPQRDEYIATKRRETSQRQPSHTRDSSLKDRMNPREKDSYKFKSNKKKFDYIVPKRHQPSEDQPFMFAPRDISAHGVMINDDGSVLLREPQNRYLGIRWEFYGGTIESGEKIQEGLEREIKEETGFSVELVDEISSVFISGKQIRFYLVRPLKKHRIVLDETKSLEWVSQDDAYDMLGKNKGQYKTVLRKVLDKAFSIWRSKQI